MKKFVSISAGILIAIILFLVLVYYINIEAHFFIYIIYIIYSISCGYVIYLYSKSTYDEYEENIDPNND